MSNELVVAVTELDENRVIDLVAKALADGRDANRLIADCRSGLTIVGERFQRGEYFLFDLIRSGDIFGKAMALVEPVVAARGASKPIGRVVIGTPKGDIHDIGKNIVAVMLRSSGFEVHDIGVNVPTHCFVEAVKSVRPDIVGMSALLTTTFQPMKETISAIRALPGEMGPKIIIGGGPVSERVREFVGADAFGPDAVTGVDLCRRWMAPMEGGDDGR